MMMNSLKTKCVRINWRNIPSHSTVFQPKFNNNSSQIRSVSFLQEFVNSIRTQVKENKDLQKDIKLLASEKDKITESETMKQAKETTGKVFTAVGNAVDATLNTAAVKKTGEAIVKTAEVVADVSSKITEPIMETEAAKKVATGYDTIKKDVGGITGNAYFAGYKPKEIRDKERQEIRKRSQANKPTIKLDDNGIPLSDPKLLEENVEQTGLVLTKAKKTLWESFESETVIGQKLHDAKRKMEENDSKVLKFFRNLNDMTTMSETETSLVVKSFKSVDPTFNQYTFLTDASHFIIPDILDAYLASDLETLGKWFGEVPFSRVSSEIQIHQQAGLISACKLVDFRHTEINKLAMFNEDIPCIFVNFETTEILSFKDKKGVVKLGGDDTLKTVRYVLVFTKQSFLDAEAEEHEETNGWVVIEWVRMPL